MRRPQPRARTERRRARDASALVVVLWCLVVLAVVVISTAHTATLETRLVKNSADSVRAYYLALAGVEKAKAIIYRESESGDLARASRGRALYDNPAEFEDVELGGGVFRVVRSPASGTSSSAGEGALFGVEDEERRLNVNHASPGELARLPRIDEVVAASIVDWRDDDDEVSSNGAEAEYYESLRPPRRIRNGPVETLRELLLVRGVTPQLLLGEDADADGFLDSEENDGRRRTPDDDADGRLERGLSAYLTLESAVPNVDVRGNDRIDITFATAEELAALDGVSRTVADAIVAYRERKSFDSIADLLDVTAGGGNGERGGGVPTAAPPRAEGVVLDASTVGFLPGGERTRLESSVIVAGAAGGPVESTGGRDPQGEARAGGTDANGPKLISIDLLERIADSVTVSRERTLDAVVNVNTAGWEVLACLDGLSEDRARAIVDYRRSSGYFETIAGLLRVPGITTDVFRQIATKVTTRGGTFRVVSEGIVPSTGARRRIEAVVRLGTFNVDTLFYREDS